MTTKTRPPPIVAHCVKCSRPIRADEIRRNRDGTWPMKQLHRECSQECKYCGDPIPVFGNPTHPHPEVDVCDGCWEVESRLSAFAASGPSARDLIRQILSAYDKENDAPH